MLSRIVVCAFTRQAAKSSGNRSIFRILKDKRIDLELDVDNDVDIGNDDDFDRTWRGRAMHAVCRILLQTSDI